MGADLSVWTKNQGTMRFGYDGFGRRVRVDDAGTEKRFIYDGAHVFMELDVSGPIFIVAEYTYYPGMDRPHSVRRGGATGSTYYYAVDYPGNVVGLIDNNDDLVARYRYAPFGESELATGSLAQANPLRFAAREYDATSGLYYMRARYYDPEVGRFISEDPLGLADGINPYLYASNNPLMGRDPTGLFQDENEGWWVDGSGCLLNGGTLVVCPHDPIHVSASRGSGILPFFTDFQHPGAGPLPSRRPRGSGGGGEGANASSQASNPPLTDCGGRIQQGAMQGASFGVQRGALVGAFWGAVNGVSIAGGGVILVGGTIGFVLGAPVAIGGLLTAGFAYTVGVPGAIAAAGAAGASIGGFVGAGTGVVVGGTLGGGVAAVGAVASGTCSP